MTAADSGTADTPVFCRAHPGETVRLLGGRTLSGFKPVTDPDLLNRLPQIARGNVQQLDLRALGITTFGSLKSRGFGRATTPAHCELFVDGKPMTLARWPNEGEWARIAGCPDTSAQGDDHGGSIGGLDKSPVWFNMVYDFMKRQMNAMPQDLYRLRYPAIADLDRYYASTNGVPPEHNVIARNVCVGKWLETGWHARQDLLTLENN